VGDAPVRAGVRVALALRCLQEQKRPVRQQGLADAGGHVHGTAVPVPPDFRLRMTVGLAVERGRFVESDRHVGGMFDDPRGLSAQDVCEQTKDTGENFCNFERVPIIM